MERAYIAYAIEKGPYCGATLLALPRLLAHLSQAMPPQLARALLEEMLLINAQRSLRILSNMDMALKAAYYPNHPAKHAEMLGLMLQTLAVAGVGNYAVVTESEVGGDFRVYGMDNKVEAKRPGATKGIGSFRAQALTASLKRRDMGSLVLHVKNRAEKTFMPTSLYDFVAIFTCPVNDVSGEGVTKTDSMYIRFEVDGDMYPTSLLEKPSPSHLDAYENCRTTADMYGLLWVDGDRSREEWGRLCDTEFKQPIVRNAAVEASVDREDMRELQPYARHRAFERRKSAGQASTWRLDKRCFFPLLT